MCTLCTHVCTIFTNHLPSVMIVYWIIVYGTMITHKGIVWVICVDYNSLLLTLQVNMHVHVHVYSCISIQYT